MKSIGKIVLKFVLYYSSSLSVELQIIYTPLFFYLSITHKPTSLNKNLLCCISNNLTVYLLARIFSSWSWIWLVVKKWQIHFSYREKNTKEYEVVYVGLGRVWRWTGVSWLEQTTSLYILRTMVSITEGRSHSLSLPFTQDICSSFILNTELKVSSQCQTA